ncbi:MAG: carbon-nitrogen hydrolase family protein [Roseibium sp.]|uniref:carbon-nitrogen hydrolase family protein n=1 Tax=Roseibium sp. TaxID=1936156 RepID=UPI001B0014EB|nr:carbon-nitrogen hydrolase family protein [Roseibium sp.]MBO6891989.1 carbon-nitrogen hydrolase family protein [Roseibium sp.]MBO6931972.1 carbon-nitrogen hydrolase family protein [Roseibium sp.]
MPTFTAACVQLRSGKEIADNVTAAENLIRAAAGQGAGYIQTPEMSNVLVRSREELLARIGGANADAFLLMAKSLSKELELFIHLGSLAVVGESGKVANRAFLIGPDGSEIATYDKIHMFDVDLPNGESWRESATYEPGKTSVIAELPFAKLGMAVCYDIRFPAIFRAQARAGAEVLTGPAAFTRQTGEAHWHVLQRARAIENGAFVVSAAQGGRHEDDRETYGHSLIVDPWGVVIAELETNEPGYVLAEIDTDQVAKARGRIPAIANERDFTCSLTAGLKELSA